MGEFEEVKPYTQAELDQQAIWADEFDQWWESEGQYHRAGGNEYCRTFAWWAWLNREQSKQSKIELLKKEKAHHAEMNKRYLGKMKEQQDMIANLKDTMSRIADELEYPKATWDEIYLCSIKALRGECE